MKSNRIENLLLALMGVVIIFMAINITLFIRMNQLQQAVVRALQPFQRPAGLDIGTKAPSFELAEKVMLAMRLPSNLGYRLPTVRGRSGFCNDVNLINQEIQ